LLLLALAGLIRFARLVPSPFWNPNSAWSGENAIRLALESASQIVGFAGLLYAPFYSVLLHRGDIIPNGGSRREEKRRNARKNREKFDKYAGD
jgi:hypothetical protein